jgi:hypothetical protein
MVADRAAFVLLMRKGEPYSYENTIVSLLGDNGRVCKRTSECS